MLYKAAFMKYSQALSLACAFGTLTAGYYLQPHYEAFTRWSVTRFDIDWEEKPNSRIKRVCDKVLGDFAVREVEKQQLDVFLTSLDETAVLGSLSESGYAFVGLPYFFKYSKSAEIPLDTLEFYRSYFPYGPYSDIGRKSMELMVLPESALKFVVARELVRLRGNEKPLILSARNQSLLSLISTISIFYACYQVIYKLNRDFNLHNRTSFGIRTVFYLFIFLFGILVHYQFISAWQRYNCFRVDAVVANHSEAYRQGGLLYYDWRIRWNQFWVERLNEYKQNQSKSKSNSTNEKYDPLSHYQSEHADATLNSQNIDENQDYYFPPNENSNQTNVSKSGGILKYYRGSRFQSNGQELWAGDGDGIGYSLIGILTMVRLPSVLNWLFCLFSSPATSQSRYAYLKRD